MKTLISARAHGPSGPSLARLVGVCGAIGLFAGCASEPASVVVSAPPPLPPATQATVYSAPATVPVQAPPAAQQEVPNARPSTNHVWVPGYWTWRNSQYTWMAGHWEVPPRVGGVWVPPRWQPEGTSWRFYEGYWD